ncbi:hypothetical protein [Fictibacillus terranigra]|uniref:Uncharacterized protein n=1 Tax=Fictibacillus terranigra TaxID=3058424 RepID=A0ABT8EDV8_9BACL|nr:hypothetical protein [Fictibacillus sp. CENA-BCM004]MDN4076071.1 hypothetical protein [Fictibacillus sp. CENA-BCM004]
MTENLEIAIDRMLSGHIDIDGIPMADKTIEGFIVTIVHENNGHLVIFLRTS